MCLCTQGHKTFNAYFGPHSAAQLLDMHITLPTSLAGLQFHSYTVWELLEMASVLDGKLRRAIDSLVAWYYERVLRPSREVMGVLGAPLRMSPLYTSWAGKGLSSAGSSRPTWGAAAKVDHSWEGFGRFIASLPDVLRAAYDTAFEVAYLLLQYAAHGKPHPPLNDRQGNYGDVMQLREEMLLVVLLSVVFCAVLAFRLLRRRLNAVLRLQQQQQQQNPPVR
jgi:hypothetical protein